jgi:hypothetical protein
LELAKMFIDQLEMIQEKTRGNLSNEETAVLRNALSNLQMVYVEVAQRGGQAVPSQPAAGGTGSPAESGEPTPSSAAPPPAEGAPPISSTDTGESKKKFTKSYGS